MTLVTGRTPIPHGLKLEIDFSSNIHIYVFLSNKIIEIMTVVKIV